MFVREGTEVALSDLLRGIVVVSGNDASVAVAEYIAGAEDAFADMMNTYAKDLGMTTTRFVNSSGLPDDGHYSFCQGHGHPVGPRSLNDFRNTIGCIRRDRSNMARSSVPR